LTLSTGNTANGPRLAADADGGRRARLAGAAPLAALALLAMLLGACSPASAPETAEALLARAEAQRAAGDYDGAEFTLRGLIGRFPDRPALHLELARLDLARDRPDLATVSIEKAREAGAADPVLLELSARAAYLENDRVALAALQPKIDTPADTRFAVRLLQARALAEDPLSVPDEVFEAFFSLNSLRDSLSPPQRERVSAAGLMSDLETLEADHPQAARARDHHACATVTPAVHRWRPSPVEEGRRRLRVGPDQTYRRVADAAAAARDGDVVEIAAGVYAGDVAIWPQNDLLVRGVGGRPHIQANGERVRDRDVWLFTGNDVVVENVEISGARSPEYRNGAAIRHIGRNLTLRHVHLHHSENGLLTGNKHADSRLLIEHSDFEANGDGVGYAHNMYVGVSGELVVRYSYSHASNVGHLLKSRAARTVLEYNRFSDEDGRSSYLLDLPYGGDVRLAGNVLEQGADALNYTMISFAAEGTPYENNRLEVVGNTSWNRRLKGIFVNHHAEAALRLLNNVVIGVPTMLVRTDHPAAVVRDANLTRVDHGLEDPREYRFRPTFGSAAVDRGVALSPALTREYVHPVAWQERQRVAAPDIGAYETCRGRLRTAAAGQHTVAPAQ
jgi:hypothetical protein